MTTPATHTDVASRWRSLTADEQTVATTMLGDAWRLLKRRLPDIETRMAADEDVAAETVRVLADAALRVLKNPDGARRDGVDNTTTEYDRVAAAGLLFIPEADIEALTPAPLARPRGAYFIPLGG